jgi:hypothetical protein
MLKTSRPWYRPARFFVGLAWLLAGLFVLFVLLNVIFYCYYSIEVNRRLAALRRAGEPTTLAEVRLPAVPEKENAAADYTRLIGPPVDIDARPLNHNLGELTDTQLEVLQPNDLGTTELTAIRQVLQDPRVKRTLAAIRAAAAKPHYVRPLSLRNPRLSWHWQWVYFRVMARICRSVALAQATDGHMAEAGDRLLTAVRLGRHLEEDPTTIAWLVGTATDAITVRSAQETMAQGDLPALQSAALQRELASTHVELTLDQTIQVERASHLDECRNYAHAPWRAFRGYKQLLFSGSPLAWLPVLGWPMPAYWERQELLLLGARAFGEGSFQWDVATSYASMAASLQRRLPERQAGLGLFRIALALNDYHQTHHQYPDTLRQLPQPLPRDPFNGQDFHYRREGNRFLLYSVGYNQRDDGGKPASSYPDYPSVRTLP